MYKVRVLQEIDDRLDAEYYNPAALSTLKKMETKGVVTTFGNLVNEGYRVVYHGTDSINGLKDSELLPFLSPTQIDANGAISFEDADKLPIYYKERYPKGLAKSGEILIEVKGNVSKVGIVPLEFPKNLMISGSLYKATLDPKRADSHYVLAFLKSKHGQILKNRLTSNTIINYIAKDALYSIPVIEFGEKAQKYIGDKVRQAEQLRAWAKRLEDSVCRFHSQFIPNQDHLDFNKKTRTVSVKRMTERLDAHFYPGVVEQYLIANPGKFESLSALTSGIYNGQTQPESSEEFCEQITVAHLSASFVKGLPRKVKSPAKNDKFIKPHDILMCNAAHNKSYIGRDLTYVHTDKKLLPSTEVMTIRVDRDVVPASYVRAYFLSRLGYVKIQSTIRGITAHSYPDDVALLDIYIPEVDSSQKEEWFKQDELLVQAGFAVELAQLLTQAAKTLVEALIEGQLTEQQLIQAQQALDDGDNSLDQEILSKLSNEGYAVEGTAPLFSDIDELYRLLQSAAQAEAEE
ncbi:restriction endonuclease subunit S [Thiopseudomonas alkaliphila]|uniref:restriction endonuclease subunit S n=1 Tax=Thiopseudomonas alkaliphila TaxID=1697053 RepID=UPI00069FF5B2|nr:restriction endonuclease subunit S [Thiopseudomonas alkaliphila]AKX47393.1 restriction endonuclease subunit S [Thiopseudomonas alkaliphila]